MRLFVHSVAIEIANAAAFSFHEKCTASWDRANIFVLFFHEENVSRANGTRTNAWANVWAEVVVEITRSQEPMRYHCNAKMTQSQHFFYAIIKMNSINRFCTQTLEAITFALQLSLEFPFNRSFVLRYSEKQCRILTGISYTYLHSIYSCNHDKLNFVLNPLDDAQK